MIIISKVKEENINIEEDTVLSGILIGNADIFEERTFYIGGVMNGNIKVRNSAKLTVGGILNGDIVDDGGEILITGIHNGKVV